MALLSSEEIDNTRRDFVYIDRETSGIPLSKSQIRAAVVTTDQWISDNAANFNNSLPAAAKTNLTKKQKSKLLRFVLFRRWEVDA